MVDKFFDRQKKFSIYWEQSADELHASACSLWFSMQNGNEHPNMRHVVTPALPSHSISYVRVYRMLFGMSLELLFKSMLITQGKPPIYKHDLNLLANAVGVTLTKESSDVLKLLSHSIVWEGRYPAPKDQSEFDSWRENEFEIANDRITGSRLNIRRPNARLDFDSLERIWESVLAERQKFQHQI
jgi:hypothetical protein